MRIVKEFAIKDIHVTIFKMGQKYTLKLEWNRLEQVYKLDARDGIGDLDGVMTLMNESFVGKARLVFKSMSDNKNDRLSELHELRGEEFPEII